MRPTRRQLERAVLITGLAAALGLFADKPLHIDDPLTVWTAKHLHEAPLDFYGFPAHWYNAVRPMAEISQNPPATAYLLALGAAVLGWSERALHVVTLIATSLGLWCTYGVAARLCRRPLLAAFVAWTTPATFVSATTLMSDVPMVALYCATLLVWLRATETRSLPAAVAAGLLAALCTLTKYFGASVFALIALHAVLERERVGWRILGLLPGLAAVGAYELWSAHQYGTGLLFGAANYATAARRSVGLELPIYIGGATSTLVFFVARLLGSVGWRLAAGIGALALGLTVVVAFSSLVPEGLGGTRLLIWWAHVAAASAAFVCILALLASECLEERSFSLGQRSSVSALLVAWVVGTVVFAGFVNWTLAARSIVPMTIPLGILLARALDRHGLPLRSMHGIGAGTAALLVSLAVASGDRSLARSAVIAADALAGKLEAERVIFLGNWGFQYYMELRGFRPYDHLRRESFDYVVIPHNNSFSTPWAKEAVTVVDTLIVANKGYAATMRGGAGFYTNLWGALPFVLWHPPHERYDIATVDMAEE